MAGDLSALLSLRRGLALTDQFNQNLLPPWMQPHVNPNVWLPTSGQGVQANLPSLHGPLELLAARGVTGLPILPISPTHRNILGIPGLLAQTSPESSGAPPAAWHEYDPTLP